MKLRRNKQKTLDKILDGVNSLRSPAHIVLNELLDYLKSLKFNIREDDGGKVDWVAFGEAKMCEEIISFIENKKKL